MGRELKTYALVQFAVVLVGSVALLREAGGLPALQLLAGLFYVTLSLANIGGLLEGRSWAGVSEVVRLAVLGGAAILLLAAGAGPSLLLGGAAAFALASLAWTIRLRPLLTDPDPRAIVVM